MPTVLTIAGSDSSGGAGIQADLATYALLGCHGASAITALTAQNAGGVAGVMPTPPEFVAAQLRSVADGVAVDAIKIGMLGSAEVATVVSAALRGSFAGLPVILDPVLVATSGASLGGAGVVEAILGLAPSADLLTPNLPEAATLTGTPEASSRDEMAAQGRALVAAGFPAVLVKGGHLAGDAADVLVDGASARWFEAAWVETSATHGTGCTLSSAIAAALAHGLSLDDAVAGAKAWLHEALAAGGIHGSVNRVAAPRWLS